MSVKTDPVIHFEMPADDLARAKRFYETTFGWRCTQLGPEAGDFMLAFTTETDDVTRIPKNVGAINGGFYKRTKPGDHPKLTVLVKDLSEARRRIEQAGGEFLGGTQGPDKPDELPGVGVFASFKDPEGNLVTVYEDRSGYSLPGELK